jgi:MFS family permease
MRAQRSPWLVVAVVLTGAFAVGINFTILAVSRPVIAKDLGVDAATFVWLISGPILANALTGTTAAGQASATCTATAGCSSAGMVDRRRCSSALLGPRVVGPVPDRVPGARERRPERRRGPARSRSSTGCSSRRGSVEGTRLLVAGRRRRSRRGLVIGGPLVEQVGWRMIFWVQAPLLALSALLAWFIIPDTPRRTGVHFDVRGQAVLFMLLGWLLFGIDRGAAWGFASPWVLASFALTVCRRGGSSGWSTTRSIR